jgi:hypothetical protein
MRLKVIYQAGDSEVFEFKKQVITVGRGSKCDLRVNGEGISREHLRIEEKDNQYFITDLGSSNGSFMNDEKLEALQETDFTTFFPVVLGAGTQVMLLNEDESSDDSKSSSSLLASNPNEYKPTGKAMMGAMMSDDDASSPGRKIPKGIKSRRTSKASSSSSQSLIIVLAALAAGYYYFFMQEEQPQIQQQVRKQAPKKQKKKAAPTEERVITAKDTDANTVLEYGKCLSETEKALCSNFNFKDYYEGIAIKIDTVFVVINAENQLSNFKFEHPLTEDEKLQVEQLRAIEQRAKVRNTSFQGVSNVDEQITSEGLAISIVFKESFLNSLKSQPEIKYVYFLVFDRVSGKPKISYTKVLEKSLLSQINSAESLVATKMLLLANNAQLFKNKVQTIYTQQNRGRTRARRRR